MSQSSFVSAIPTVFGILSFIFPFILWVLAVYLKQINPFLPFISDLGITPPGASLFTLFLCTGACLEMLLVFFRYRLTRHVLLNSKNAHKVHMVKRSLYTGCINIFTMLCIGSFRNNESTLVQVTHNIVAPALFISFLVDIILEIQIAKLLPEHEGVVKARKIILFVAGINYLLCAGTAVTSFSKNPEAFANKQIRLFWSPNDPGYVYHVISTVTEWILILSISPMNFTYRRLFRTPIDPHKASNNRNPITTITTTTTQNGTQQNSTAE